MDDMLSLCGLWTRKDKNDIEYFVGKLTYTTKLMVFKNKNKTSNKDPDYYITLCKNSQPQNANKQTSETSTEAQDDIPF